MVSTVTGLNANQIHSYKVALGFIQAVDKSKWKLEQLLTLKAPPIICSRRQFQFFLLFQK